MRTKAAAAALLAAVALSACGSSGPSASRYAKSVCTAIGGWVRKVESYGNLNLSSGSNLTQRKAAVQRYLGNAVADTDHLVSQLKSAGTPDISGGSTVSSKIVSAFSSARDQLQNAKNEADTLPTQKPSAFRTAARRLGGTVRSSLQTIAGQLASLKNKDFENATKKTAACGSIAG